MKDQRKHITHEAEAFPGQFMQYLKEQISANLGSEQKVEWTGENEMTITTAAHGGQTEKVEVVDMSDWSKPLREDEPIPEYVNHQKEGRIKRMKLTDYQLHVALRVLKANAKTDEDRALVFDVERLIRGHGTRLTRPEIETAICADRMVAKVLQV